MSVRNLRSMSEEMCEGTRGQLPDRRTESIVWQINFEPEIRQQQGLGELHHGCGI